MTDPIMITAAAGLVLLYAAGDLAWRRFVPYDRYYFFMVYAAFASLALTVMLTATMLLQDGGSTYSQQMAVSILQSAIAVCIIAALYKRGAWKRLPERLSGISRQIIVASLLFSGGIIVGTVWHEPAYYLIEDSLESIDDIADALADAPAPEVALMLFGNNTRASLALSLALSLIPLIGGVYAAFGMMLNGAIVGVVAMTIDKPLTYFLIGILPHGIFEIPAIILAAAVGMRINGLVVHGIINAFGEGRDAPSDVLKAHVKKATEQWDVLLLVLLLLVIAAAIESSVTPYLLSIY